MPTARISELEIAFDDVGAGKPILFIHGSPFNRSMWRPQVERFSSANRVITYDLRGYGGSTVVSGKTTLEMFAEDAAGLLDFLGITEAVIVGLSTGGQIALEFCRQWPERVSELVLADTSARPETAAGRQTRYALAERLAREGMYTFAGEFVPQMLAPQTIQERPAVAEQVLTMMRTTPPEGVAAALRGRAERRDYVPLLGAIRVPTLVVVGREDTFTTVSEAKVMHKGIAGSRLAIIDGAGHMPPLEQPAAFNAALGEFLNTLAQGSG